MSKRTVIYLFIISLYFISKAWGDHSETTSSNRKIDTVNSEKIVGSVNPTVNAPSLSRWAIAANVFPGVVFSVNPGDAYFTFGGELGVDFYAIDLCQKSSSNICMNFIPHLTLSNGNIFAEEKISSLIFARVGFQFQIYFSPKRQVAWTLHMDYNLVYQLGFGVFSQVSLGTGVSIQLTRSLALNMRVDFRTNNFLFLFPIGLQYRF